jgi:hypothetical protein
METPSRTGVNQPVTQVAAALPADPSRAKTTVTIHHHGNEAPTAAMIAPRLQSLSFIRPPFALYYFVLSRTSQTTRKPTRRYRSLGMKRKR